MNGSEFFSLNELNKVFQERNISLKAWGWSYNRGNGMLLAKFKFGDVTISDIKAGIAPKRKLSSFKTVEELAEYLALEAGLYKATDIYFFDVSNRDQIMYDNGAFLMLNKEGDLF